MIKSIKNFKHKLSKIILFYKQICYSQNGEDLILDRLLDGKSHGFYVDVGAHHPIRFSNTYLFYRRGWCGVNIDAMPGSMKLFRLFRRRDINIECGVAMFNGQLLYHLFDEPALNTFSPYEANHKNKPPYHLIGTTTVPVYRLDDLLERYLPNGQKIDFLTVDVEGLDEQVLRSNNWNLYRPQFILVETLRTDFPDLYGCAIVRFLQEVGYEPVAKAYNTIIFKNIK